MSQSILFVENREKTEFWAAVARELMRRGHEVAWLVQNPAYSPRDAGAVHLIGYPTAADRADGDVLIEEYPAMSTDRGRQYFDAGSAHYPFYSRRVHAIVRAIGPALVIGETTLIQELFAVEAGEAIGATFLHPAGERYPDHRFSLVIGTSLVPYVGSGDQIDPAVRRDLAERIATGRSIPSYMVARHPWAARLHKLEWALTRIKVLRARAGGERYNTPSLARKIALARKTRANSARWDALARRPSGPAEAILYPLQLQPESSIDVWGRPFSDQVEVVERLLAALPADMGVAVKSNPKEKYEMSDGLLSLAEREPRVLLLPRAIRMAEAHTLTMGAVTVCGTVGLEAVFGRGRCISLRHPALETHFPDFHAATPEEAVAKLLADPAIGHGSVELGERLLDIIVADSFAGLVSDPLSDPHVLDPENIAQVANGVEAGWRHALMQRDAEAA